MEKVKRYIIKGTVQKTNGDRMEFVDVFSKHINGAVRQALQLRPGIKIISIQETHGTYSRDYASERLPFGML